MEETAKPSEAAVSAETAAPKKKRSAAVYIFLAVIIILQLAYTIFCFETKKTGSYGDEIWSYGLANSYYKPFLYIKEGVWMRDETPEVLDNMNEWVDGEEIKDYITVQPGQQFAYGSVVSNQTFDNHPPLYYMLLHTICSFFPNSFSYTYAFVLSCILLVINGIFMFKLGETVLGSEKYGLLLCAFFAASTGGLSTFIFLRQYNLLTPLTVSFTYFTAKLFRMEQTAEKDDMTTLRKTLPFIMLTSFLAFMTHYFAVPFVGLLTFFMCITFLCRRRIKKMFIYGFGVLASLLLFFALFPSAIKHTIGSDLSNPNSMGDLFEFKYLASIVLRYSVGLKVSLMKTDTLTYVIVGIILLAALTVPLGFLFRKEKWFAPVKERAKAVGSYYADAVRHPDAFVIFLLIDVAVMTAIISKITSVYYFEALISRYVFYLMPICCVVFLAIVKKLLCVSKHVKKFIIPVTAVICAALCVRMHLKWDCPYYFQAVGSIDETCEMLEGKNILAVVEGDADCSKLTEAFPPYVYKANKVYFVMETELKGHKDDILSSGTDIDYVFVPSSWYALNDDQYAELTRIMDERNEHYNEERIKKLSEFPTEDLFQEYQDCRNAFDAVCPECDPELFLNINMGFYYLMKVK